MNGLECLSICVAIERPFEHAYALVTQRKKPY